MPIASEHSTFVLWIILRKELESPRSSTNSQGTTMSEMQIDTSNQNLAGLLAALKPGEEVAVVENGQRVAVIRKEPVQDFSCKAGSAAGKILYMSDDFDAPLDDFAEYMQ